MKFMVQVGSPILRYFETLILLLVASSSTKRSLVPRCPTEVLVEDSPWGSSLLPASLAQHVPNDGSIRKPSETQTKTWKLEEHMMNHDESGLTTIHRCHRFMLHISVIIIPFSVHFNHKS